ncbi:MAG: hypothetical protein NVSMB58_37110 [Terriglobales bacterium]
MKVRVGWASPFTPMSGVGTFSQALLPHFNSSFDGVDFDFTLLVPPHASQYPTAHRAIRLGSAGEVVDMLGLFDILVYCIGNNTEHHALLVNLLRARPGIVICHDYVYQHYFADICFTQLRSPQSFGAMIASFYGAQGLDLLESSGIASVNSEKFYAPWETSRAGEHPLSDPLIHMASGLVVHSQFSEAYVRPRFHGPVLKLGMPCDQKIRLNEDEWRNWRSKVAISPHLKALSFGHLNSTKHIHTFLAAFASSDLLRRNMQYVIAGHSNGAYLERLRKLVIQYGLQQNVSFEISVSDSRLHHLVCETDLFVNLRFPNTEGASASLAEQMQAGKPSLIYASGCYAEIPADASLVVHDLYAADEIVALLEKMVQCRGDLIRIGRRARDIALTYDSRSYMNTVKEFIVSNYGTFERRSRSIRPGGEESGDDLIWHKDLNKARLMFFALERNWLPVFHTATLSGMELSRFFVTVVMGLTPDAELLGSIHTFLIKLDRSQIYRVAALAYIISSSSSDHNSSLRERLSIMVPIFNAELWELILRLPQTLFEDWVSLALWNRPVDRTISHNMVSSFPISQRKLMLERVSERCAVLDFEPGPELERLKIWLSNDKWVCELRSSDLVNAPILPLDQWLPLSTLTTYPLPRLEGVHPAEEGGTWTAGLISCIRFRSTEGNFRPLEFRLRFWTPVVAQTDNRRLTLVDIASHLEVSANSDGELTEMAIQLEPLYESDCYAVKIVVDKVFQPSSFSLSTDDRELGAFIKDMRIAMVRDIES